MRFSLVLALALAGLTMTAAAQKHQKPKAKPSYTEEKRSGKSQTRAIKKPATHGSTAQELRRVEQSSAKVSASRKAESGKAARTSPALKGQKLKGQKKEANPPIHFASSGSSGKGSKSKGGDPTKGRLRHKGSHH